MSETAIQWTDVVWNPVTGCSKVSQGCAHCYAERLAPRVFAGQTETTAEPGSRVLVERPRRFTDVRTHPERLDQPLRWRKPRRVFVNSMSDLFHEDVPDDFIARVWAVMAGCPQHTFQVLTKRPERMRDWLARCGGWEGYWTHNGSAPGGFNDGPDKGIIVGYAKLDRFPDLPIGWPLPNVWLGVSVEDQRRADERIPILLDTPAAVRFLSCEPLLGRVDLRSHALCFPPAGLPTDGIHGLDWLIVGGESGPKARPMDLAWARSLVAQCRAADVPVFCKQMGAVWAREHGASDRHGGLIEEFPEDLRVRDFPEVARAHS